MIDNLNIHSFDTTISSLSTSTFPISVPAEVLICDKSWTFTATGHNRYQKYMFFESNKVMKEKKPTQTLKKTHYTTCREQKDY